MVISGIKAWTGGNGRKMPFGWVISYRPPSPSPRTSFLASRFFDSWRFQAGTAREMLTRGPRRAGSGGADGRRTDGGTGGSSPPWSLWRERGEAISREMASIA
jgi:hypothetical protein